LSVVYRSPAEQEAFFGAASRLPEHRDFTASDLLSPRLWDRRAGLPPLGIDVSCTKIAVDFQSLESSTAEAVLQQDIAILRESTLADAAFIAIYDAPGTLIERVIADKAPFTGAAPESLAGVTIASLPWIGERLGHSRLLELRDTLQARSDLASEALVFGERGMRAVLVVGFAVRGKPAGFIGLGTAMPVQGWDVSFHLLLKLVGISLGTGLDRVALAREHLVLRERNALVDSCANDGVWEYDALTQETHFSARWKAMLGYGTQELDGTGPGWRRLVHPEDLPALSQHLRDHVAGARGPVHSIHRLRHRDGDWRWVESRMRAQLDAGGALRRLVAVEYDITERKRYEEALFREKEDAQVTLHSIGDGVITADRLGRVEYLNPVAEGLTGWHLEEVLGREIGEVFRTFHEETCEALDNPLLQAVQQGQPARGLRPVLLVRRDGNELYVSATAAPRRSGTGEVVGGVLVFRDVTESRELQRRLTYHASHDVLTGLPNRREFEQRLERAIRIAQAGEGSYALLHLDLDQFKIINDTSGHNAGDALLGQLGTLMKGKVRWRDAISRLGGDEFAVLLEHCAVDEALRLAEGLREAVRGFRFPWGERSFRVTTSIGVVMLGKTTPEVGSALSAAESACTAAKESGRNRVHCFEENDLDLMRRRREMQWAARINAALEEGRFELHRQAILPLQGEESGTHFELLIRMRDEHGALIPPDHFIAAAERYNLMPSIDRWVVESAFRWLVSAADERANLALCAINLSGQSMGDDQFLPFVIDQFRQSGLDATKICFEITETSAIANFSQASRFIQALRGLGCRFALDDFGTGLSSFGYLKHFQVDFLKIDGSFVKDLVNDSVDREMVRSINEIGHLTGKKTIAEYAENEEIVALLRALGVDYAQGFGVARPERLPTGAEWATGRP
jgi:diguanylate cyclase (GGDEF)-like protein/PAS domain S-box-containing protein